MDNHERKNRIKEALEIRGLKQVDLVERTGFKKASVNGWVKQRWQPKQKAIAIISRVLDVSEMWLAGYDTPMERAREQVKADELAKLIHIIRKDERLINLISNIATLNDNQLTTVESMVNELSKINSLH